MLRETLSDADIPKRHTLRRRVEEVFEEYLQQLKNDMKVSNYINCLLY